MLSSHINLYLHIKKAINSIIQKQMDHRNKTNSNIQNNRQKQSINEVGLIF